MSYINANSENVEKVEADVCIIGAGAVGLSMALSFLKDKNLKIVLIESGGEQVDPESFKLNEMECKSLDLENPPTASRMRMLGGSTNCWGGWCRPISESVFKKWPINRSEMLEHRVEADSILQLKAGDFDSPKSWYKYNNQVNVELGEGLEPKIRQVKNIRLWPEYKDKIINASNLTTLYNLTAYNFLVDNEADEIKGLICKSQPGGKQTKVIAKKYVMAAGGLENPALLLNMDLLNGGFFSKRSDAIGKYYSDHYEAPFRYYALSSFIPKFKSFHFKRNGEKFHHWVRMNAALSSEKYPEFADLPHSMSFYFHAQYRMDRSDGVSPVKFYKDQFGTDSNCSSSNEEGLLKHETGALLYASPALETNKILLTDQKHSNGHFKGKLEVSIPESEIKRYKELASQLEKTIRKSGLARANIGERLTKGPFTNVDKMAVHNGRHHMGGTRMAISSKEGVVDTNLKMHGVKNLYIGGPGVFPHFDWHGPTYSAVMMALRLKHHLVKSLTL